MSASPVAPHVRPCRTRARSRDSFLTSGFFAVFFGLSSCGTSSDPASPIASGASGAAAAAGNPASGGAETSGTNAGGTNAGVSGMPAAPAGGSGGTSSAGGGAEGLGGTRTGGAAGRAGNPSAAGGATAAGDPSDEVYAPDHLPRFELTLSAASLAALAADPDTYVTADFSYGDETLTNVGVRIKGEGSRRTLDEKAAFKLKFDEFASDRTFRGLRRLTLNNMVEDPSFLAERLAYHLFRAAGLPAPRCNSALVHVNGEFFGVYANVEAEDKTFLRRWFSSDEGNLYEEGQQDFTPGAEALFDLETNQDANDRSDLANLIAVFQAAQPDSFLEDLGAALDTEQFLRFTAAEAAVNQWDMYAYTMFWPNNFRLYNDPNTNLFVFLPWGMDMSMKPFRDSSRKHLPIFGISQQGDRASAPVSAGLIFQRCLASTSCKARYAAVVAEIVEVYEQAGLEKLAIRYYEQIKSQIELDPRQEFTTAQRERGYQGLLSTIRERPAAITAEL
jgi:spore coat protein CotH